VKIICDSQNLVQVTNKFLSVHSIFLDQTRQNLTHYFHMVPMRNSVFCENQCGEHHTLLNHFQSNFSATRILPSCYLFWVERGWWVTCNYPTVLKEKNINRKSTTCAICWLKSVLHEEKRREQENHNVGRGPT
jgi:hypothetical protein